MKQLGWKPLITTEGSTIPFPLGKIQSRSTLQDRDSKPFFFALYSWLQCSLENARKTLDSIRFTTNLAVIQAVQASINQNSKWRDVDTITFLPRAERIIAIGDVHGDLQSLQRALLLSKVVGMNGEWVTAFLLLV